MLKEKTLYPYYVTRIKYSVCVVFFILSFFGMIPLTGALLGEDLGLDLYKKIDEGFYELEQKQYEYELKGQGETSINEVVGPILKAEGLNCDIQSSQDIEKMLGNSGKETVAFIVERCSGEGDAVKTPALLVQKVQDTLGYVKNAYSSKAQNKSEKTYEIARIGLYSDGNIENSSFDLIHDIKEIDKIIFSEEIEYNGVEQQKDTDDALDDFLKEDKSYLYEDTQEEDSDKDVNPLGGTGTLSPDGDTPIPELDIINGHNYICPINESGLTDDIFTDIVSGMRAGTGSGKFNLQPRYWRYPSGYNPNSSNWGGPFPGIGPDGVYEEVRDDWPCDPGDFFCIIIEFQKSDYGLAGGQTMAIDKILARAGKHLEKPANASLTQRKMTTNNFELGSIIKDLPGMLRGFGIDVQSKPVPILDVKAENEEVIEGDLKEVENLICTYYKNAGLDCNRENDIESFIGKEYEQKIFQTSAGMPITYPQYRSNKLSEYQGALKESNRTLSKSFDEILLTDDMKMFGDQFAELEKFVVAMQDFVESITGLVGEMKKIPSRAN